MPHYRVCTTPGCAQLVTKNEPCPLHGRPKNAPWGRHRSPADRADQAALRKQVLARDNWTCVRCGHHDPTGRTLDCHHTRGSHEYLVEHAETLCNSKANGCHRARDQWAR